MNRALHIFTSGVLSILLTFAPLLAQAQETPPETTQACEEPVAVNSPCSGVLLPLSAATEGLQCLRIELPRLRADLTLQTSLYDSRINRYRILLAAEEERSDRLLVQLQDAAGLAEPKWYEHPAFHFAMGFVVATAATIGITYAVNNPD